jgi:hypothetical protein
MPRLECLLEIIWECDINILSDLYVDTNVSKEHTASIFMAETFPFGA